MNLNLTEEQRLLQDTFARLFASESTSDRIRDAESTGFDEALWKTLQENGIALMRIPESAGGLGSSLFDAMLITEQAGRCLASVPLVECLVTSRLLAQLADVPAAQEWLESVIASGTFVSFAFNAPCLLYTSPSPRDLAVSRMPSSA